LPASLRKAMVAKFEDFDLYQLGKYNKVKKKNAHINNKHKTNKQTHNSENTTK